VSHFYGPWCIIIFPIVSFCHVQVSQKWHYSPRNKHLPSGTFAVRVLRRGSGVSASQLDECRFWQNSNKYTVFISWCTSLLQNSTIAEMLQTTFNGNQSASNWKFFYLCRHSFN